MLHFCDLPGDHPHDNGTPILKPSFYDPTLSRGPIYVTGGLHHIRGNRVPYFSLTLSAQDCGGCMHDEILGRFPDLAPLAALHLCDIDGVPMHAVENGFYWLAGYAGGLGCNFHGGNGTPKKTADECLAIFASHFRIPAEHAQQCADWILAEGYKAAKAAGYRIGDNRVHAQQAERAAIKALLTACVDAWRPGWKREADECRRALGLTYYYGDRMEG